MNLKKFTNRKRVFSVSLAILLCISVFDMSAQHKISLSYKEAPLKTVLKNITAQTGYDFIYSGDFQEMNENVTVSLNAADESIENILKTVFKGKKISFEIKNKKVMIAPSYVAPVKNGQSKGGLIKGTVTDEAGESLPGVAVKNTTTNKIVAADLDGKYEIEAAPGDKLLFASIGMADYEATIGKNSVVNISLTPDAIALADVVVTGYQTLSKERSTGSFNVVTSQKCRISSI